MRPAAAFAALPVSALAIWLLLRSGLARRMVSAPTGERWHTAPTPLGGGIGIFAGVLAGAFAAVLAGAVEPKDEFLGILGGCTILFVAGLADDLFDLGPLPKLGAQFAAAGLALASGLSVQVVENDVLAVALALVWLVGITNAFNLLDNMDGLAATLAAIACFYFALDAYWINENVAALVLAIAIGLACAGFLPFNVRRRRRAAIFMGDSGSQVLGFALGALGLFTSYRVAAPTLATLAVPIAILAVPIFDTALVTIVRLLEGRPVHKGGRDHTSHRLVYQGLSETRALVLLAVISGALGATSLAYSVLANGRITALGVLLTFAALVQFASFLGDVDRRGSAPPERGPRLVRLLVVNRRRLVEVFVDAALVSSSFLAAYLLVVGGSGTTWQRTLFMYSFPVVLFARYLFFIPLGLYRGVWRYAGARDAAAVIVAVVGSSAAAYVFVEATHAWADFPRSVFVVDALLCTTLVGAARFAERAFDASIESMRLRGDRRRTLIVGAGRAGRSLLRELRETPREQVIGFVDDDPRLRDRRMQGVRVLGGLDEIERIVARTQPDAVLVTIPDADHDRLDRLVRACELEHVACRFVRRQIDLEPSAVLTAARK